MRGHKAPGLPLAFEHGTTARAEQAVGVPEASRRCSVCRVPKSLDDFHLDRRDRSGRQSQCRDCRRVTNARYGKTGKYRAQAAAYRARPDVKTKDRERKRREKDARSKADKAYAATPRGKVIRCRGAARYALRRATTDRRRAALTTLIAAYDAELRRMDAARAREAG